MIIKLGMDNLQVIVEVVRIAVIHVETVVIPG